MKRDVLVRGGAAVGAVLAVLAASMVAAGPVAAATPAGSAIPVPPPGAVADTYGYTGGVQKYIVKEGTGWLQIKVIGGPGGMNSSANGGSAAAEVDGTVKVSANDTLTVSVAGAGGQSGGSWTAGGPGGWGGLGAIGGEGNSADDSLRNGGSGGGASTVELTSGATTTTLMIAGGGGGKGGASGDPDHAGDGGSGGDNAWTGGDGSHGTEGPLGGSGGQAAKAPTSVGERGKGGSEAGGNGGAGGGGLIGGAAGGGASAASAGGGGGAGSSYAGDAVLGATVKRSTVAWCNVFECIDQPVPNGSITITPIPLLATTTELAVQNSQVTVGGNAGPLTAIIAPVDGYAPAGTVDFLDITNGTGSSAVDLGSATVTNGAGAIPSATFTTAGTRKLQAVWSGDANYAPATSPTMTVTVSAATEGPRDPGSSTPGAPGSSASSPGKTHTPREVLAQTGYAVQPWAILACLALAAGASSLLISRRRRNLPS